MEIKEVREELGMSSSMFIKAIREDLKMSQSEFAENFGFNLDTLQNWEQGRSKTPEYVFNLLFKIFDLETRLKAERRAFDKFVGLVSEE